MADMGAWGCLWRRGILGQRLRILLLRAGLGDISSSPSLGLDRFGLVLGTFSCGGVWEAENPFHSSPYSGGYP